MQFENLVKYDIPTLDHVEPVLPVRDIVRSVSYWHEVLGFPQKWTWGDPPNHGGLVWGNVHVQLSLDTEWPENANGHCIWIRVRQLDFFYEMHQRNKVDIVAPLQNKPWGFAEYIVKEINGHYLVFTAPAHDGKSVEKQKAEARIVERT